MKMIRNLTMNHTVSQLFGCDACEAARSQTTSTIRRYGIPDEAYKALTDDDKAACRVRAFCE